MSFQKNYHLNDTTGASVKKIDCSSLNLTADFVVENSQPEEVKLTSIRSPMDCPETIRLACHPVDNIYRNTGISAAGQHPLKAGMKLVASDRLTVTVSDEVQGIKYYAPVTATLSVTVPSWEQINSDDVMLVITRTIAALFNTDDAYDTSTPTSIAGIERKLRGSEMPKGIS